ncbi:MAG: NTP transferase domain-containing protein [Chloroflexi bacterium]|nr:NTP transferase domain-containing protein [Chloroflexota bacterium]
MDAIILAGGKGTRMMPLTQDTPKPLLHVQGRPILAWSLLSLPPTVDQVLIVVKYLKEHIETFMAQQQIIARYHLVEQLPEPLGTGHALQCCQPHLESDEFIVLNGDDLYSATAVAQLAQTPLGILTVERDDASKYGVAVTDTHGNLIRLHEKPPAGTYPPPVKVNIGGYKFNRSIFSYDLPLSERGEYEITDYVTWLAARENVAVVPTPFWRPIGTPDDLATAQDLDLQALMFDGADPTR